MSHTPGPWVIEDDRKRRNKRLRGGGMLMVVAEKGGMPGLIVNQAPVITPTDEANARLIAAAPDLLEVLQMIVAQKGMICDCGIAEEVFDNARAAIAKAEGK